MHNAKRIVDNVLFKLLYLVVAFVLGASAGWFWEPVVKLVVIHTVAPQASRSAVEINGL